MLINTYTHLSATQILERELCKAKSVVGFKSNQKYTYIIYVQLILNKVRV